MPLINTSLPNLIQGVSQQPDVLRYDGQCEEQENALSSVIDGLVKRPNTRHVARLLEEAISANSFVHFINRSKTEKYVVINDGSYLRAWNLDGTSCTINGYTDYDLSTSYLGSSNPQELTKALTVADGTFLLKTDHAVGLGTDYSPAIDKEALVFVKQGDYEKNYTLNLQGSFSGGVSGTQAEVRFKMQNTPNNTMYIEFVNIIDGGSLYESGTTTVTVSPPAVHPSYSNTTLVTFTDAILDITVDASGTIIEINILNAGEYQYSANGDIAFNPNRTWIEQDSTTFLSGPTGTGAAGSTTPVTVTSGDSEDANNADSSTILEQLHTQFELVFNPSNGEFTTETEGNLMVLTRGTGKPDFVISGTDGLANTGLGVVYKEVSALSDLPTYAKNGFTVKVVGDVELNQDDYYVKFETTDGQNLGQGSWRETIAPETRLGLDASTLPQVLLNTAPNTFTLSSMSLKDRAAGDDTSNPLPSFVSQPISNLFFFKNRLGFLSNDNIILSESGLGGISNTGDLEYNFSRTTVTTLLDSDPIDVSVASTRVTNLKSAKGFQDNLIVFSANGQFVLKGGDILSPSTVSISPITNYEFDTAVDPLPLGSYLYFPFTRGNFSGLREYSVNATSDTYDSVEITEHVPSYIPSNVVDISGTSSESIIAILSANEASSLYIYKYFWSGNQKVLSAWSKFTFEGDIRGIQFVESSLYVVAVHNSETQLLELPLESGLKDTAGYTTHLDQRVEATVLAGASTITLPYTPDANATVEVYTKDGQQLLHSRSGSTITLSNPVSADTDVWVGYAYNMKYTLSEQLFKASSGNSKSPSASAKLMIRNGSLFYNNTAHFTVKVTPKARNTYVNTFTPNVVGSSIIGSLNLDSGFYRFPVFTKAEDTTITIENDTALPSNFTSAEFESFTHSRSNRYG